MTKETINVSSKTHHQYELLMSEVMISIEKGKKRSRDYADMRAAQLNALLELMFLAEGCRHSEVSDDVRDKTIWLARCLAEELSLLIGIVADDVRLTNANLVNETIGTC